MSVKEAKKGSFVRKVLSTYKNFNFFFPASIV